MERQVSVTDLIHALNDAASKMSSGNYHKLLMVNAAWALKQLVDRLYVLEGAPKDQVN